MTTLLARRLGRIERIVEETRRRPIRERVLWIMRRFGVELSTADVEAIVTRHVGTPARIDRMRRAGWSDEQIRDQLLGEVAAREAS